MKRTSKIGLLFFISLLNFSCYRQTGPLSNGYMVRSYRKIAKKENRYYVVKAKGDTLSNPPKSMKYKYIYRHPPDDIVEYHARGTYAIRYRGDWIFPAIKGKMNLFFGYNTIGSQTQFNHNERNGVTTTSKISVSEMLFFFQKGNGEITHFLTNGNTINLAKFKTAISDNEKCLDILNSIEYIRRNVIKDNQSSKFIQIFNLYNK